MLPLVARAGDLPITLFAFDDHSLPYRNNLKLTFEKPQKHPDNPVVAPGPPGSADAAGAAFYGSVLREGGRFRMWYRAQATRDTVGNVATGARLAYAESNDGKHWSKPNLGLTEFQGNTSNNLLGMPPELDYARTEPLVCFVLHEPDDPDPARRYKMVVYCRYYPSTAAPRHPNVPADNVPSSMFPCFSADGLTWKLAVPPPRQRWFDETEVPIRVRNNLEIGGLYKFDGIYHLAGQALSPDIFLPDGSLVRRTMVTHWSGDFVHWSQDRSFSFQRHGYRGVRESLEEAHEPAGVWNRGNVLLGLYGLWHGAVITSERRMDLGFLVSNDGIHFREPIADHVFIPSGPDGQWDQRGLLQGQGYENVGDETYVFFGSWDISGVTGSPPAIGLATLPRDRFAFLSTRDPGDAQFTSMPLSVDSPVGLHLNVDGLSDRGYLDVELIHKDGTPVAGYSGKSAARVASSGFHVPVRWPEHDMIDATGSAIRLRLRFAGPDAAAIKLYAAYVEKSGS